MMLAHTCAWPHPAGIVDTAKLAEVDAICQQFVAQPLDGEPGGSCLPRQHMQGWQGCCCAALDPARVQLSYMLHAQQPVLPCLHPCSARL